MLSYICLAGIVTADPKTHFDLLKTIWFTMYSRGHGKIGSSAFEHVFLGELKNNSAVSGLHNWVYYYFKEAQTGTEHPIDYKGYLNSILLGDVSQTNLTIVVYSSKFLWIWWIFFVERTNCKVPFFLQQYLETSECYVYWDFTGTRNGHIHSLFSGKGK